MSIPSNSPVCHSEFIGSRLILCNAVDGESHDPFGLKMYEGLTGKIMKKIGKADYRTLEIDGKKRKIAINISSLMNFYFRTQLTGKREFTSEAEIEGTRKISKKLPANDVLKRRYKKSKDYWGDRYTLYKYYFQRLRKDPLFPHIFQTSNQDSTSVTVNGLKKEIVSLPTTIFNASCWGVFRKIKRNNETIGYIVGTISVGDHETNTLNPCIIQAALKSNQFMFGDIYEKLTDIFLKVGTDDFSMTWKAIKLDFKYHNIIKLIDKSSRQAGLKRNYGVNEEIRKLASDNTSRLYPLQTPGVLIENLKNLCAEYQGRASDIPILKETYLRALTKSYNEGDTEEIFKLLQDNYSEDEYRNFITDLNKIYSEKILHQMDKADTNNRLLVAVDVRHMVGNNDYPSVIDLIRRNGRKNESVVISAKEKMYKETNVKNIE